MLKFDHLVHFTHNPEHTKVAFQTLGFNAIHGGKHQNWGTFNNLCYFQGLRYIEWIGIMDMETSKASDNVLIQQIVKDSAIGEGFSQLAFRVDNLREWSIDLKKRGFDVLGPVDGSRKKDDGTTLSWSMLFIKEDDENHVRYPFFIQWGHDDDVRELAMQSLFQHNIGRLSLSYLGISVKNRKCAVEKYSLVFNFDSKRTTENEDSFGVYSELVIGDFFIRFYESKQGVVENLGERPFLCGISGVNDNKLIQLNGGIYHFFE
ncbi:VOC family protein [Bacillus sp. DJP31]|uniref:VOC family protein n=1 Tax=Bacillus sp. DJP31 TaxID=3409789 RepID=UPI003BB688A4